MGSRFEQLCVANPDIERFPFSSGSNIHAVGPATPDQVSSWMANFLPHLEQQALYDQAFVACRTERLAYLDPPHAGNRTPVAAFACPADVRLLRPLVAASGRSVALASYIGVAGSGIAPFLPMNQEAPGGGFNWH